MKKNSFHKGIHNLIKALFTATKDNSPVFDVVKTTTIVRNKTFLYTASLLTVFLSIISVHAQFFDNAFVIKTVNVYPSKISGEGWNNLESISVQNLDDYALLQEFNTMNSATIDPSRKIRNSITPNPENVSIDEPVVSDESDSVEEDVTIKFDVDSEDAGEIDNFDISEIGVQTTTTKIVDEPEEFIEVSEEESEPESTFEEASTTVLRRVESVFSLAVGVITSAFDGVSSSSDSTPVSDTESPDNDTSSIPEESEVEEVVVEDSAIVTESEEVVSEDVETDVQVVDSPVLNEEGVSTTTEVLEENETVEAGNDSVSVSNTNESTNKCTENCVPYVIDISDFSYPLDEGVEVSGAQLRMSFAAQKKSTREIIPDFSIYYTIDGGSTWLSSGSITIEDESSNSINGGYFLFALGEVTSQETLDNLKVQLVYNNNPEILRSLFVESVWLELFTLEAEDVDNSEFADSLLGENGFDESILSGDNLKLPNGEVLDFKFTDENEDESLIIKTTEKDYVGLTKTTTHISVTNTSDKTDEFSLQTYFPRGVGEVTEIREFNQNVAKDVVVPEYRPFVYHCEAGWEYSGEDVPATLEELSKQFTPIEIDSSTTTTGEVEQPESESEVTNEEVTEEVVIDDAAAEEVPVDDLVSEESVVENLEPEVEPETEPEVEAAVEAEPESLDSTPDNSEVVDPAPVEPLSTNVFKRLNFASQLLQYSTTTPNPDFDVALVDSDEEPLNTYSCRSTNVVRVCDSIDGDNTACRVDSLKVNDHQVVNYQAGWEVEKSVEGPMAKAGLLKRMAEFIGFGPDKKEVPENFEARTHSEDAYTIRPGETKYFEMEISFPPFSGGEFWIEAVGKREYGLLDPFWSSQWRYRKPITIDNTSGSVLTEQQVFLEFTPAESDFWSNIQDDGGDLRFVQETPGETALTWYDTDWLKRLPIVIVNTKVDADMTDFPVYVDLSDLGDSFFSDVASDGSDIRITAGDKVTELPYELVDIDTGAKTGELHFKAGAVSSSTDTTFYIYFENDLATAYAAGDTYGAENVWSSEYVAVYHLGEAASGRGNIDLYQDSTLNEYDADDQLNSSGKSGILGAGQEVSSYNVAGEYILVPSDAVNGKTKLTFSYWMNSSHTNNQALISGGANNELLAFLGAGGTSITFYPGSSVAIADLTNSTWRYVTITRDTIANQWEIFVDGVSSATNNVSLNTLSIPANCLVVGLEQDGCLASGDLTQHLKADIDEMRFMSDIPSDAYIAATFDNQKNPATFYSTSTVENVTPISFIELDYWIQHFDYSGQEADVWVQVDSIPSTATSTIYAYYGNAVANTTSDEFAPFTYSTSTDLYYVVNNTQTNPIIVYSLIDGNEVKIDGGTSVALDAGETTSFATYASTSVISTLGPITARASTDGSENLVPISFATTTFANPSNRVTESYYTYAPFASASVSIFNSNSVTPIATGTVNVGNTRLFSPNITVAGILEATNPVLFYSHSSQSGLGDGYVAYPPTLRPLFGIHSNSYYFTAIQAGSSVGVYCSSGSTSTSTSVARGSQSGNVTCTSAGLGTGNAVKLVPTTVPISAIQQADGNGGETSTFLPMPEMGTTYYLAQDTSYVSVVCPARFGTTTVEVQTSIGAVISSGTCTPAGVGLPGALNFTPGSPYPRGYKVVSTNSKPFYIYYEDNLNKDESQAWSGVQAKKYNALYYQTTFGAEEENEDAQYEQNNYRWYQNINSATPTTPWDIEGVPAAEDEAITGQGAVNPGDELRLRMNLLATNGTGTIGSVSFKLQYAEGKTCTAVVGSNWHDVASIGSTTAPFAGFNNASVGSGTVLPSALLSDTDILATYDEQNNSASLPNEVGTDKTVEYDWVLKVANVTPNAEYCFRMIRSTDDTLTVYNSYPELLTAGPPEVPIAIKRFDNERASSTKPTLTFAAVDQGSDDLDYQVQVSTDSTFGSVTIDRRSDVNLLNFENLNNNANKSPFDNGNVIQFTPTTALTDGVTYWWRVRAIDPTGSNTFGGWNEPMSFTVDTTVVVSEWFQTTDEQFETDSLNNATTSGSDSVELSIAGSNLVGEYGKVAMTNGATTTVTLDHTYANPVVVASIRYPKSVTAGQQVSARVFNKTSTSFDIYTNNYTRSATGTSTVDYMVMEAGDYLIDNGADGYRVFATSTSVSAYAGKSVSGNPGGPIITFPSSFSGAPVVLSMLTTINDPSWAVSTLYDGNDVLNTPTSVQMSAFINDQQAADGHLAAEDIDMIAFDKGSGDNNGVAFDISNTGEVVTDAPYTHNFSLAFSAVPGVTLVSQLATHGGDGSNAMVDLDTPATASAITVAAEEGGTAGSRGHTTEDIGIVAFADNSGDIIRAGNAQIISTPIKFTDGEIGNAWREVKWNDTGDITYHVQYQTGSGFVLIPDEALPGNSTGFTTSPINILDLDTDVYGEIRLVANLAGVDPEIFDWSVKWGLRVEIPTLGDLFNNEKTASLLPTFDFFSSDPQGDDLEYEIEISVDPLFATYHVLANSSASSSNFANETNPGDSIPFNTGDTITYTLPAPNTLSNNTTYWWRVRAKDPAGANSFSPWSEADSFTTDTTVSLSTWFQTTQAQFSAGVIDGVVASTSNSVVLTNEVGEYGVTTVNGNTWLTVNTELTYEDMVVVGSPEYASNSTTNGRTIQVRNKTSNSFEIRAENDTESLGSTTTVHYLAIESGDWLLADGGAGTRFLAGTAEDVSNVEAFSYDGIGGTTINFSPAFASAPEAILTISSANNSKWTGTAVSSGGNEGTEITTNSMDVSMGISSDVDTVRVPEDIDYIVFDTGFGTNNGTLFDALRGSSIAITATAVNYNQTFSSAPGVTLVHNNANDGAQGGFAQKDTASVSTNTTLQVSVAEMGLGAGAHNIENVSILAFEATEGTIVRDESVSGGLTGTIASEPIYFSDGAGPKFNQALFSATTPGNSTTSVQVQYQTASGTWALIPDVQIPGNSVGDVSGVIDLTSVNPVTYPTIRLLATLTCDVSNCPELHDWTVEWSEGVLMSGTIKQYDRTTNVTSGTVSVSVNGSTPTKTGTISAGTWSISNVTAFTGDTVTVFVSGAADANKAVGVFVYDGLGDMTGIKLFEQHLSLASDETATTTIYALSKSDNSSIGDDDIFFDVDFSGNLTVCAVDGCENANLYIGSGNKFVPASTTGKTITTHSLINNGKVELDANTVYVSGSWENNGQIAEDTSSVVFIGSEGGWYGDDWSLRLPITVAASAATSTLTNFPVYVNLVDLPASFFSNVKADGSDIRITQANGLTEVPYELVSINTGAKTGQLHFKAPRISDSMDTVFYIYIGNASATAYSVTDTYGRNNVWNDYEAVWHYTNTSFTDSTGNPRSPTNTGVTATTIGDRSAINFNGSSYLNYGNDINMGLGDLSITMYLQTTDSSASYIAKSYYSAQDKRYSLLSSGGNLTSLFDGGASNGNNDWNGTFRDNTLRQVAVTYDRDSRNTLYSDGVLRKSIVISAYSGVDFNATNNLYVGTYNNSAGSGITSSLNYTGKMTEVKISRNVLSADWIAAEDINQRNRASFYSVGTTSAPSAGIPSTEYLSGTLNFNNLSFNDTGLSTTWETLNNVVVKDDLKVTLGTLNRGTSTINIAGDLITGSKGYWSGLGTTTFDGSGASFWKDNNLAKQNVGRVVVDGSVRTVTLSSGVSAASLLIGANDTLNAGGANTLYLAGNFTNNNIFIPQTGTIQIIGTSTVATIKTNGSSLYNLTASTTGMGTVSFSESSVSLLGSLTIATGTVNAATATTTIAGSLLNTGGTFVHNNAAIKFTGTGAKSVRLSGTAFLNSLYNVSFTGNGTYTFLDVNATTTNNFLITAGNVVMPSGQLVVGRNFLVSDSGLFTHNNGEVIFLIDGNDKVTSNSSSFNNVRVRSGTGGSLDWYNDDWDYRIPVTVRASAVDSNLTNFPVYVDLSDFDSTNLFNHINANGSDIRMTQADGLTEVAREIVSASSTIETGEMYFLANSISSSTDTVFYLYYGNNAASDYAVSATYGAQNVWSNGYVMVAHLNDETSSTVRNSANGSLNGTKEAANQPLQTSAGKIYAGQDMDGSRHISFGNLGSNSANITISAWFNPDNLTGSGDVSTYGHTLFAADSANGYTWLTVGGTGAGGAANKMRFCAYTTSATCNVSSASSVALNKWSYVSATAVDGGASQVRVDGTQVLSFTNPGSGAWNSNSYIGDLRADRGIEFEGILDEFQISNVIRSTAWQDATYRNQATTTNFYAAGSAQQGSVRTFSSTNMTALGNVVIESGAAVFPIGNFNIGGSFDNNAEMDANGGTLNFNSASGTETISFGTSTPNKVIFNSSTGNWTIIDSATTTDSVTLTNTGSFTLQSGKSLTVGGQFTTAVGGASTTWSGSNLILASNSDYAINTKTAPSDVYGTLTIRDDADISLWNSSASSYSMLNTASLYSQDHAAVDGDLYIFGNYQRTVGTEYWSYATDFDGATLATSSRQVDVRVANGASVNISTSSLQIFGTSTATTTINSQSGSFALTAANATVTARYFESTGTNINGFNLTASTTVPVFSNSKFTIPAGFSAITVDASTIDKNPTSQFFYNNFISGSGNVNVNLVGTPSSYWWFREGMGDRYGEAFDNGDSDPGSIRWDDSSYSITIAGTVYADDGVTPLGGPTCDGTTNNVRVVVNGGTYIGDTSCSGIDGTYTLSSVSYIGDPSLVVFLNTGGGVNGSVVTKTPTADILDLDIYSNRVVTRHEDVTAMTISDMVIYDEDNDSDLRFVASTSSVNTLVVRPGSELFVSASTTFTPNGNITLQSNGVPSGLDGSLRIGTGAIFTGAGTSTYSIGGNFTQEAGATFISASSTVIMTATTTGKAIVPASGVTLAFNTLNFTGVGGGWNLNGNISAAASIQVATGTVTGTGNINVLSGSLSGDGVLSLGGGTTTISRTNTLGGIRPWTFFNLKLGNGTESGTTTPASSATTTVGGMLTIANAHTLAAGNSVWDLSGTSNVFVKTGNLSEGTSTFRYSGAGANVLSTTYYNLLVSAGVGSATYTASAGGLLIKNNLTVGGATNSILNINTSDPVLEVRGNVLVGSNGTLEGSNSGLFSVVGNWTNTGIFNGNSGTVNFTGSSTTNIAAGSSGFSNVVINGAGNFTLTESATSTGNFNLMNHGAFTLGSGNTLAVGSLFTNGLGGALTTWTGSTLSLYGNGNYSINASTTNDVYDTLAVGAGTQVNIWNSSASAYAVDANGGLYSQDHSQVDGDLYIWGKLTRTTGADYWSYARDFDGTVLTGGAERVANVYFASGANATWSGASLSAIGGTGATTTIQNQGSGTYALTMGTGTTVNWDRVQVRNTNINGIVIAGTASVTDFSRTDHDVQIDNGTAITVGGTAIDANPAKNFTNNVFAAGGGVVSPSSVTATGTAVSSWRFTNHTGNIAGEAYDSDPAGDPGYIVWDDSAALITVSGNVYSDEGSTVSSVCDGSTNNIRLVVAGITTYNTSCSAATGLYSLTNVAFGPVDTLTLYINDETEKAANVSMAPISSISNMHLYENRVIVRHENTDPITIAKMAVWDSSDDADIQFTAVDAGTDTLTIPANNKLLIWTAKTFEPNGNITLTGGAGSAYNGTLEAQNNATFRAKGVENHTVGGSVIFGTGASYVAASSTLNLTTTGSGRTLKVNSSVLNNVNVTGSGSLNITDSIFTTTGSYTQSAGAVTLPTGTTTIGAAFNVTGGSFVNNGSQFVFTSNGAGNTVRFNNSTAGPLKFTGLGSFNMTDVNATSTGSVLISSSTVTLPSGNFGVGGDFQKLSGSIVHNTSDIIMTATTTAVVTASSSDLYAIKFTGPAAYTITDPNITFLDSFTINNGSVLVGTGTLSVGGSFIATGGTFNNASGTVLMNASASGKTINPGVSPFYNLQIGAPSGGYTMYSATTTNNFTLASANIFTVNPGATINVGGVFSNTVGGVATTWTNSTLKLNGASAYSVNSRVNNGDVYGTLAIGPNSDIKTWYSSAATTTVDVSSSLYSQDNANVNGALNIYGDLVMATTTEYWNYARDFDGTDLTGSERKVTVSFAPNATTTVTTGSLQIIGASGFETSLKNQGTGAYSMIVNGGSLNANYYEMKNLNILGLQLKGLSTITNLANGYYELSVDTGSLITLASTTLNANPSKIFNNVGFTATTSVFGYNVKLTGSTTNAWRFTNSYGNIDGESFDVDGVDDCGSVRFDDSSCLLTEQTQVRWRNDDGGEGAPDSEWFNTDWDARKSVRVKNADATTYTDAAVQIFVNYDSDMQADFGDLYFTDSTGITPVPFWFSSTTNSSASEVWVKLDSLPANDTTTLFMYYKNPTATTTYSSSTQVFIASDSFEDGNISEYSGQTTLFGATAVTKYDGQYGLDNDGHETSRANLGGIYRFDQTVSQGETFRYLQYVDTTAGSGDEVCTMFGVQSPGSTHNNYGVCFEQYGTDRISLVKNVTDNESSGTMLASSTVAFTTGWYEVEVDWGTDDSLNVSLNNMTGASVATISATDSTYTSGGFGFTFWFHNGAWDAVSSRPTLTTEPSIVFGAEQGDGGATWLSSLNSPAFVEPGDTVRLRLAVENSGLDITGHQYRIEYAAKGVAPTCGSVSSGSYAVVPNQASCGLSPICMQTSTFISNGDSTTDRLFGTSGQFTAGKVVTSPSNQAGSMNINQNHFTELEYVLTPTGNASDAYCFRVTNAGTALDFYSNIAELGLSFEPSFGALTLNDGDPISLTPGTTTAVTVSGTVTDFNGYADLSHATATIYRSGAGASCTADNNNCYLADTTSGLCSFDSCSGNSCQLSCTVNIQFHADPTDASTYEGEEWLAYAEASDFASGYDFASAPGVELITLRAMDVDSLINYGSLEADSDTGAYNPATTITNIGNVPINIDIEGTNLTDGLSSSIPAAEQKVATSTFTYSSCVTCQQLSTSTPVMLGINLGKPSDIFPPVTTDVYWGIEVPFTASAAPHSGTNIFTPIGVD